MTGQTTAVKKLLDDIEVARTKFHVAEKEYQTQFALLDADDSAIVFTYDTPSLIPNHHNKMFLGACINYTTARDEMADAQNKYDKFHENEYKKSHKPVTLSWTERIAYRMPGTGTLIDTEEEKHTRKFWPGWNDESKKMQELQRRHRCTIEH